MSIRELARRAVALGALAGAAGCASSSAPYHWLPEAELAQQEAFGGWIEVRTRDGVAPERVDGELIVVTADSLHILTTTGLASIARGDIKRAVLSGYNADSGALAGWTALGTVSTLSHGFGLIFSAPVWVITGIGSSASVSRAAQVVYPKYRGATGPQLQQRWDTLRPFARFPGGWPSGLDRASLRPRPFEVLPAKERYRHRGILDRR